MPHLLIDPPWILRMQHALFVWQDDPCLMDYNVEQRVEEFVNACGVISNVTRGNDIMLPMGTDFTYANAHYWYAASNMSLSHHNRRFVEPP